LAVAASPWLEPGAHAGGICAAGHFRVVHDRRVDDIMLDGEKRAAANEGGATGRLANVQFCRSAES
jgi:hypothetical protein